MEYWTGDALSHPITQVHMSSFVMTNYSIYVLIYICTIQKSINLFRYKLAGILYCWKTNTAPLETNLQENNDKESNSDNVLLLETADAKKTKALCPMSIENKYYSLCP
jgi:hypothetical protein